jgi:hypothetical protein
MSQHEQNVNESIEMIIRRPLDVQTTDFNQVIDILFSIDTLQLDRLSVQLISRNKSVCQKSSRPVGGFVSQKFRWPAVSNGRSGALLASAPVRNRLRRIAAQTVTGFPRLRDVSLHTPSPSFSLNHPSTEIIKFLKI